jgi:hypothetical protein
MATLSRTVCRLLIAGAALAVAQAQAATTGIDARPPLGAYLNSNMPATDLGTNMPLLLSQTGAFTDTAAMSVHPALVPYRLNAPLWSDASAKFRWVGLPFDGTPGSAGSPTVGNHPAGKWTFPNGTVIVKHFELTVNEQTNAVRRLETRLLVRDANGGVYGRSYRWRDDNLDADLVNEPAGQFSAPITVVQADGSTRTQTWHFPGPAQCLECHNDASPGSDFGTGMVLGLKTRQMNGVMTYPSTGRTASQLNTWRHLGMFTHAIPEADDYPQFERTVALDDPAATLEHKVRSYVDSNCGFCHLPGGPGPIWDGRYSTPILQQNIAGDATLNPFGVLRRFDLANSRSWIRDAVDPRVTSFPTPMPPLARNIPHAEWLAVLSAYVNYPFDTTAAVAVGPNNTVRLKFDRALDAESAEVAGNYAIDGGISVLAAALDPMDASRVILTTTPMTANTSYRVVVNRVREAQGVKNPVWPNTWEAFTYLAAPIAQAINFPALADRYTTDPPFTLSASGGTSGNPVTFTALTPAVCSVGGVNNAQLTLTGTPGLCTVAADQAGSDTHGAAPQVTRSFKVLWRVNLVFEGAQQVPPVVTTGSGSGTATYDATNRSLALDATIAGLSSAETMAHIHGPSARGANAGVLIDLATGSPKVQTVTLTATQETQLLAGLLYINVHTVGHPAGEVRAQLDAQGSAGVVLQVKPEGPHAGFSIVQVSPACTAGCTGNPAVFPRGSTVTLVAPGTVGDGDYPSGVWQGCDAQTFGGAIPQAPDATCSVTLDASRTLELIFAITGIPSEPRGLTALAGDARATLNFLPPLTGRGQPVTGYTASCTAGMATVSQAAAASPIVVPLVNGLTYQCSVVASTAFGTGPASLPVSVTPLAPVSLMSVKSRKVHKATAVLTTETTADLHVLLGVPLDGAISIEPRLAGPRGHQLVFTFDRSIASVANITAMTAGNEPAGRVTSTIQDNTVTVTLTELNAESFRATVRLDGINGTDSAQVNVGFLPGDVNASGRVTAADAAGAKARINTGQVITAGDNFRFDINLDGTLSSADVSAIKGRAGRTIP